MQNYLRLNFINYFKIFIILLLLNQLNESKKVNALKIFEEQNTHSPYKKNYSIPPELSEKNLTISDAVKIIDEKKKPKKKN